MRSLCTSTLLVTALVTFSAWSAEPTAQTNDASALMALEHTWVEALQSADENDEDQRRPARAGDGVSSIIISSNDMAGAWAMR